MVPEFCAIGISLHSAEIESGVCRKSADACHGHERMKAAAVFADSGQLHVERMINWGHACLGSDVSNARTSADGSGLPDSGQTGCCWVSHSLTVPRHWTRDLQYRCFATFTYRRNTWFGSHLQSNCIRHNF